MKKLTSLLVFLGFLNTMIKAQDIQISGKVTGAGDGSALPGVSVVVKGTTIGTTTNIDGNFELSTPQNASLVFSFIGMKTKEVSIEGRPIINVGMEMETTGLEEVVVTALGISKEKKALGYAVQDVGAEELNRTQNTNVVNSLAGKVAGVNINSSSGVAGSSSFVTIRGVASLTRNNQPLFVVDGVPIDNSQSYSGNPDDGRNNLTDGVGYSNRAIDINPDDIESISVLKGGAATAMYGMRAANGVIMITTKKGKESDGKLNISFSTSLSLDKVNKYIPYQMTYGQGSKGLWEGPENKTRISWGPKMDTMSYNGASNYPWDEKGKLVSINNPGATGEKAAVYNNPEDFFQTGMTWNHNLNLSGGNEKSRFYMSLGHLNQEGIIPNNIFKKTTLKISGETKLHEKFSLNGSANYIHSGGDRIQQGSNTSGVMLGLYRTSPSFDNSAGYVFPDGSQRSYRGYGIYDNPYWTINKNPFSDRVDRLIGYIGFNFTPTTWLSVNYKLGTDHYSDLRKYSFEIGSGAHSAGQVAEDHHHKTDINSDLIVNVNKDLTNDFNLNTTLGWNLYSTHYNQLYVQGDGNNAYGFEHISNTSEQMVREETSESRTAAYFGDIGLSYMKMLFLNLTGRYEWSTTLPEANNAFFYPAASLGIIFTELGILKDNTILSYGKLRASMSQMANTAPAYVTKSYYSIAKYGDGSTNGISFPLSGKAGFYVDNGLGNNNLEPEFMKSIEFGTELKFFKNRLGIDATYFINKHEKLLLWVPLSGSAGYTSRYMNAGEMVNKGIELVANITPVQTKDFTWDVTLTYSKINNEVKKLAEGVDNVTLGGFTGSQMRAVAGMPYGSVYGSDWVRDEATGLPIIDNRETINGKENKNYGRPIMSPVEAALGSALPDWTGGITNSFTYKSISLSFLLDFRQGGKMWNGTRGILYYFGTHKDTEDRGTEVVFPGIKGYYEELDNDGNPKVITNREVNDIATVKDQSWYQGLGGGWGGPSSQFIEETSWIRLRELNVSYNFSGLLKSSGIIKGGSIYFTGRNLWLSTDYSGIDPETSLMGANNAQGLDYFNMPNTRTYTFGLKLDF